MNTTTPAKATKAAFGPRTPYRARIRAATFKAFKLLERVTARKRGRSDALLLSPAVRSAEEFADLAARLNWYLPSDARNLPLAAEGAVPTAALTPGMAPHMDPPLVHDPGLDQTLKPSRPHVIVHRVTPRSIFSLIRHAGNATCVDSSFAYGADETYFRLHRQFCSTSVPASSVSLERLQSKASPGGTAFVLATGPSANEVAPDELSADVRITCNSAVRDRELIERYRPSVLAFGDPVFHYGPSRYAAAFRRDLIWTIENSDAVILTTDLFVEPLLVHVPEVRDRIAVVNLRKDERWGWPTSTDVTARITGNVLTNLMLPAAFALADHVKIAGCDGRNPDETYYWKHNVRTQYADDLMQAAFETHEAFFRDRTYSDYYDEHIQQLADFLAVAEAAGKSATCVTRSHIPALLDRGAPRFS